MEVVEMEKGRLIVSTKSAETGRKTVLLVCAAVLILVSIIFLFFMLTNDGVAKYVAKQMLGSSSLSWVIWLMPFGLIIGSGYNLAVGFLSSRSYCDVYEFAVTGMSALSRSNPNSSMQHFELQYQEIMNVTESGTMLYIYTQYTTYEVLAMKNRAEAIKEIRTRMKGGKD